MAKSLDWEALTFGVYNQDQILKAVEDEAWQETRRGMKGTTLKEKYNTLTRWLKEQNRSEKSKIQVTNYVNALRRGGLVARKI